MRHKIIYDSKGNPTSVSVFPARGTPKIVGNEHPNFREIVDALEQGRPEFEVVDMFDLGSRLARGFRAARTLIERIARITDRQEPTEGPEDTEEAETVDLEPVTFESEGEPLPPPSTDGPVDLSGMKQRDLQKLAHELGVGSVVGKSNDWIRQAIQDLLDKELNEVIDKIVVSERGEVSYDGVRLDGRLAEAVYAYWLQGSTNYVPLLRFLGKVMGNPQEDSRERLYDWLAKLSFHIHQNGNIIAYKGVAVDDDPAVQFRSTTAGHGFVDDVEYHRTHLPHPIGSVVHMPREEVTFNPDNACASGLHVGTVRHAQGYGRAMIEVEIDPRDVVSVPRHEAVKMRVCRYRVRRQVTHDQIRELRNVVNLKDL